MALAPVSLDDLTWDQLVDAARQRIIAESGGEWTLHAPVDPGITLIELYAWLLEQRVFWLDQVPDTLVRAFARLLGFESRTSRSAATVLAFEPKSFQAVSRGTGMKLSGNVLQDEPPVVFSTDFSITLLPFPEVAIKDKKGRGLKKKTAYNPVQLYVGTEDRSSDLADPDRIIELLPRNTSRTTKIILWLTQPIPDPPPAEPLTLLFELVTSPKIPPQWSSESVDVPEASPVTWFYEKETDGQRIRVPFAKKAINDGTGGFRRSGILQITIPSDSDWIPHAQVASQDNLIPYALWIHADFSAFTSPPVIRQIIPNVVIARHRLSFQCQTNRDWLPLPGQKFELPPDKRPVLEKSVKLWLKERSGKWFCWKPTSDLAFHSSDERVFVADREQHVLIFGDGLTGRQPVLQMASNTDAECQDQINVEIKYDVGGGKQGNIATGRIWEQYNEKFKETASITPLRAENPVSALGGKDPETIEAFRRRIASDLKTPKRAVTKDDYIKLVQNLKGVAFDRVYPAIGYHPKHPCTPVPGAVTLFVVPYAPRNTADNNIFNGQLVLNPKPDAKALQYLHGYLNQKRLLTSELFICEPKYRAVNLRVKIAKDHDNHAELRTEIETNLKRFLDPLVGGDDGKGWPFGGPLRPSAFVRQAQQALDNAGHVVSVSIGLDGDAPHEDCDDVEIGPHELVFANQIIILFEQTLAAKRSIE
jgi:hypothetical protein